MFRLFLTIWEWEWIFSCAVEVISSPGIRSPSLKLLVLSIWTTMAWNSFWKCIIIILILLRFQEIILKHSNHRLWTPNEGHKSKTSKNLGWCGRHSTYASAVPKNLGVGVAFRPCSEDHFLSGRNWYYYIIQKRYFVKIYEKNHAEKISPHCIFLKLPVKNPI